MTRFWGYLAGLVTGVLLSVLPHADGHWVKPRKPVPEMSVEQKVGWAERGLRHYRYVAARGSGKPRLSHGRAARWMARELAELRRLLIPAVWYELAVCESGRRPPAWHINTGNGFLGGLQFLQSTWIAAGGLKFAPGAHLALPWQQVWVARGWLARTSWAQWPECSARLGLR